MNEIQVYLSLMSVLYTSLSIKSSLLSLFPYLRYRNLVSEKSDVYVVELDLKPTSLLFLYSTAQGLCFLNTLIGFKV